MKLNPKLIHRRNALTAFAGTGMAAMVTRRALAACIAPTPPLTEGPYFIEEKLLRSDIRTDPASGTGQQGTLLTLSLNVQNQITGDCVPLSGAYVDIWHASWDGHYSDEPQEGTSGQKYLRGYQITDDSGNVQFTTVFPGWYRGRTVHIHLRVRTYFGSTVLGDFESQAFFDDSTTDAAFTQSPYSTRGARDTRNANDGIFNGSSNSALNMLTVTKNSTGYAADLSLAVSLQTPAAAAPVINSDGVVSAASGVAGIAPGSWISIYGANLAASAHALANSDIVNNSLPVTLAGVGVKIDGKSACVDYVSPAQLNVLAPDATDTGSVSVTVTNAAGTSAAVKATLQTLLPALFMNSKYVAAVSGNTTVAAAKPGDTLELYGTGFGPAKNAPATGKIFTGAYPTTNTVTVTIGDVPAEVLFAGLVGAGLYQINVKVPAGLTAGDKKVVANVGGFNTEALLKIETS